MNKRLQDCSGLMKQLPRPPYLLVLGQRQSDLQHSYILYVKEASWPLPECRGRSYGDHSTLHYYQIGLNTIGIPTQSTGSEWIQMEPVDIIKKKTSPFWEPLWMSCTSLHLQVSIIHEITKSTQSKFHINVTRKIHS